MSTVREREPEELRIALRSTRMTDSDRVLLHRQEMRVDVVTDPLGEAVLQMQCLGNGMQKILMPDEIERLIADLQKALPHARAALIAANKREGQRKAER